MSDLPAPGDIPADVAKALGGQRASRLTASVAQLQQYADHFPTESWSARLLPVRSQEEDPDQARSDLDRRVRRYSRSTSDPVTVSMGSDAKARPIALATDVLGEAAGADERQLQDLMLFDTHTLLSSWLLSGVWRAAELADVSLSSVAGWRIIAASASARAMLEGVAAFVVEGTRAEEAWVRMKRQGRPDWHAALTARKELDQVLMQPSLGTRLGTFSEAGEPVLERTNILTLLRKFLKHRNDAQELAEAYDWLCDAVHPSFGSNTAFVRERGFNTLRSTEQVFIARQAMPQRSEGAITEPDVAQATALAVTASAEALVQEAPLFERLLFDYGLTTGVAYAALPTYYGHLDRPPDRNDPCPCGSGLKSKRCDHSWGGAPTD